MNAAQTNLVGQRDDFFLGVHHAPLGGRRHAHHAKEGCERQIKPAILRAEGLAIGKVDYVGYMMKYLKQPAS